MSDGQPSCNDPHESNAREITFFVEVDRHEPFSSWCPAQKLGLRQVWGNIIFVAVLSPQK